MSAKRRKIFLKQRIKNKDRENTEMLELAKAFLEKECIIYTFDGQLQGTIKKISDNAILLERKGDKTTEIVNADFIVRIREFPKNKKGKSKSVILD